MKEKHTFLHVCSRIFEYCMWFGTVRCSGARNVESADSNMIMMQEEKVGEEKVGEEKVSKRHIFTTL